MSLWFLFLCVLCPLCVVSASAQVRRPRADVTPLVAADSVHAGGPVRVALKVSLPEGLHTQSNKPRDENLIPTVLTVDAPAGVTVDEIVWPPAQDLNQIGQEAAKQIYIDGDKAHFTKQGATQMAKLVAAELKRVGSPLGAYVK